jgi:molybdenum cofactor biosynthesis protein B
VKKPHEAHRSRGKHELSFYITTVSSGRFAKMKGGSTYADESGDLAEKIIRENAHKVLHRNLIADDPSMLNSSVNKFLRSAADVLVLTGGTGISPTDVTVDIVRPLFEKELVGFGEMLRSLSFKKIGSAAMMTRSTAGIVKGKLILCLPGSPDGVETALLNFISEFPHVVSVARGT